VQFTVGVNRVYQDILFSLTEQKKKNNNLKGLEAPEVVEIFDFSFQLGLVISWSFFRPFSLFFPLLRTTRSKLKTAGSSQESNSFSTASEIVPFFLSLLLY
jgi:hypothetical protein